MVDTLTVDDEPAQPGSRGAADGIVQIVTTDGETRTRLAAALGALLDGMPWCLADPAATASGLPVVAQVIAAPFDAAAMAKRLEMARRPGIEPVVLAVVPPGDAVARSTAIGLGADECLSLEDLANPLAGRLVCRLIRERRGDVERRALAARITDSEDALEGLVALSPDGLLVIDRTGTIRLCNAKAADLLGRPRAGLTGSAFGQPLSGGDAIELDVAGAGARRIVEMRLSPLRWLGAGEKLVSIRDVTPPDASLEGFLALYRQGRALMAAMVDALVAIDREGRIVWANPAAERLFEAGPERLAGLAIKRLFHARHDLGPERSFLDGYCAAGDPDDLAKRREMRAVGLAGRTLPVDVTVSQMPAPQVDAVRPIQPLTLVLVTDISERKASELELLTAKRESEVANRAKSDFLASMTHELRTPLNAIIGFAEMIEGRMLGDELAPRYREYARDIRLSGKLLLEIIADILDMAKIEAGRYDLAEGIVDIRRIITDDVRMLRMRADERSIQVVLDLPPTLPMLRADERAVRQALLNLLSNALKFTDAGGQVTVRAGLADEASLGIEVADTGRGMTATDLEKAFLPFVQVRASDGVRHRGTGLGLPITKAFMDLHGGTVDLVSRPGEGTTARLVFPAERVLSDLGS